MFVSSQDFHDSSFQDEQKLRTYFVVSAIVSEKRQCTLYLTYGCFQVVHYTLVNIVLAFVA